MSLLASGRDPNQRSDVGCPAMGMAAANGHADVIHHLLLYQADEKLGVPEGGGPS
eukprot:COSAG06_NODE_1_length_58652_cov_31.600967_6_plen_55_part_00